MDAENATLQILFNEQGLSNGCKRCREIFNRGQFSIGLSVGNGPTAKRYVVGIDPPVWCCGEEKKYILIFANESDAKTIETELFEHLKTKKTTEGLRLYELSLGGQN